MKVSREQAAENRERIINAAAKLYREHGFGGIGVADLMRQAGMTHGGFYGHFASKEDLIAQACERASHETLVGPEKSEKPARIRSSASSAATCRCVIERIRAPAVCWLRWARIFTDKVRQSGRR